MDRPPAVISPDSQSRLVMLGTIAAFNREQAKLRRELSEWELTAEEITIRFNRIAELAHGKLKFEQAYDRAVKL